MSTKENVSAAYVVAMKAKDNETRDTLKLVKAAFSNMEIAYKFENKEVTDKDYLTVVTKLIKKGEEAAQEYEKAGDTARATKEKDEVAIFRKFVPTQLTDTEVLELATRIINESGEEVTKKNMSVFIKQIGVEAAGRATGKSISDAVKSFINAN